MALLSRETDPETQHFPGHFGCQKNGWKVRLFGVSLMICFVSSFQVYNLAIANNLYPVINPWLNETIGLENKAIMDWEWSFFASSTSFGKVFGTLMSGFTMDRFGRKPPLYFVCFMLLGGGLISGSTRALGNLWVAVVGRFIIGIGAGFGISIAKLFLVEISPIHLRGRCFSLLNLLYGLGDMSGLLLPAKFLLGTAELWPICLVVSTLPSVVLLLSLNIIPETPRHLIIRRKDERKGLDSLIFYHGTDGVKHTLKEMHDERTHLEVTTTQKVTFVDVFRKAQYLKPLLISMTLNSILQCSIFLTILYSTQLIEAAGFPTHVAITASISIGVIKFGSGFLITAIIDHHSRRLLILIGSFACTLSLGAMLASYSFQGPLSQMWVHMVPGLVIACFVVYNIFYSMASAAGGLMCLELFLQEARAKTVVIVQAFSWLAGFIFPTLFFPFFKSYGPAASLAPIVMIMFACSMILWWFMPETRERTFLEVKKDIVEQDRKSGFSK